MAGSYYVPLPKYEPGPGINFEPLNRALDGIARQKNIDREFSLQERSADRADQQFALTKRNSDLAAHDAMVKQSAGIAQAALGERDPTKKAALMTQLFGLHPEYKSRLVGAGIDPNDFDGTANFIVAEARGYLDPRESAIKDVQLQQGRLGLKQTQAQIEESAEKRDLNRSIRGLLSFDEPAPPAPRANPGGSQVPPGNALTPPVPPGNALSPNPSLQPQSFLSGPPNNAFVQAVNSRQPGGAPPMNNALEMIGGGIPAQQPQPMPNGLILAADRLEQPTPGPQMPPQQQPSAAPDMVDTPLGPMTRQRARRIGMGLSLVGKDGAGKAMLDSTSVNNLGKAGENEVDQKAAGMVELAGRLDGIAAKFKPEYLTYETAAKQYANSWLDSFDATREGVSEADRKQLAEYTAFKQDATNNLSEYIKYITGAAMGIQEEGRIRQGMPDPAKDSPVQFEAKMRNSIAQSKLALARYSYLKRHGYDENTIATLAKSDRIGNLLDLDSMQTIINQRLNEAATEIKQRNPQISDMDLKNEVRRIQKVEFGI